MTVRKVGTCDITREVGRGGMGVVYEARQEGLERTVAVKELAAELAKNPELATRFRREGLAYAQLRHQAIVAVYDLVEKLDALYLITEFVDGADLSRLVKEGGPLPSACVAVVGARVAEALDYVHFRKLLHRDIKPANVMISRDGEVKLMDFGIAKDQTADDLTRDGLLVGSPSFLAPEVLGGEKSDPQSDQWALGVTLYELACGQKPFAGNTADELFAAIRKGRFVPLRARAPQVPRRLASAIERCLRRRPNRRWENMGALAREFDICAGKYLHGFDPRGRLVALMTHRGFASQEQALTCLDAAALLLTADIDAAIDVSLGSLVAPAPPPRRWVLRAALAAASLTAAGVGAAYYFHALP